MNLELHIVQNFVPSNLNRDDTGTPKDCVFGGVRRARISSQCLKRAIRLHPKFSARVEDAGGDVGKRTKLIRDEITKVLVPKGIGDDTANAAAAGVVALLGLKFAKPKKDDANARPRTEYLLYLGQNEVRELAEIASRQEVVDVAEKAFKTHGEKWQDVGAAVAADKSLKDIGNELKRIVSAARTGARSYAADIALFGRMVADDKSMNVDAACQVAHAISTNRADMDIDFYTAVDDFNLDDAGAGMMGTSEFTSACFYRYANLDLKALGQNLAHNGDLLNATALGFVESSIMAVPSGKQNSSAAHNPPSYVRIVVRDDGFPWSLAGAFSKPVAVPRNPDSCLEGESVLRMNDYFDSLKATYGAEGILFDGAVSTFQNRSENETMHAQISALNSFLAEKVSTVVET